MKKVFVLMLVAGALGQLARMLMDDDWWEEEEEEEE